MGEVIYHDFGAKPEGSDLGKEGEPVSENDMAELMKELKALRGSLAEHVLYLEGKIDKE